MFMGSCRPLYGHNYSTGAARTPDRNDCRLWRMKGNQIWRLRPGVPWISWSHDDCQWCQALSHLRVLSKIYWTQYQAALCALITISGPHHTLQRSKCNRVSLSNFVALCDNHVLHMHFCFVFDWNSIDLSHRWQHFLTATELHIDFWYSTLVKVERSRTNVGNLSLS